ncbi:hypothetical protein PUMCH_001804 [Australozyma saopauloensis]|uniref:Uncharacterized protein n=1 Tax=Australozyma saopauloensis TaxID=291208 RepID=A0AAX4H7S6_9ASCO|nr:hypothetical protein PUMCH_001804 [[Candida] saopauloensis]
MVAHLSHCLLSYIKWLNSTPTDNRVTTPTISQNMISVAFKDAAMPSTTSKVLLCLLALFIPPLPIYLMTFPKSKVNTREFWISLIFTVLLFGVGALYTIYFILVMFPDARLTHSYYNASDVENQEEENGDSRNCQCNEATPVSPSTATPQFSEDAAHEEAEPLLPAYNEIAPNSTQYKADSKSSDNKVQR